MHSLFFVTEKKLRLSPGVWFFYEYECEHVHTLRTLTHAKKELPSSHSDSLPDLSLYQSHSLQGAHFFALLVFL